MEGKQPFLVSDHKKLRGGFSSLNTNEGERIPKTNESNFKYALDNMLEGVQIHDFEWRYIYVNNTLVNQSTFSKEELLGYTLMEKYPGIEKTHLFEVLQRCMQERTTEYLETEFVFPNSSIVWFQLSIQPIPEGIFILSIDITAKKKAEADLKRSESLFRKLIERNADMMTMALPNGHILYASPSISSIMGFSTEEYTSQSALNFVHPDDLVGFQDQLREVLKEESKSCIWQLRLMYKDGQYRWCEGSVTNLLGDPEIGALVYNFRDISARKKWEEEQQLIASIIDSTDDAIISKTLEGTITSWNRGAEKVFGYAKHEIIGKQITELIPFHFRNEEKEILQKIKNGELVDHYETVRKRKDGQLINVSLTISPIYDSLGNIIGASKISKDITAQKESESLIIASEKQIRYTLDHMLEGVQMIDFDWRYIYVNDALVKYSQYPKELMIGKTVMEIYPGVEEVPLYKVLQRTMNERITEHIESEFVFPNGSVSYFELSIQPVPTGIFILSIDITERKKAEAQIKNLNEALEQKVKDRTSQLERKIQLLRESEEKFEKAFQSSAAGISITHMNNSKFMDVNNAFVKITGYSKEETLGKSSVELGFIVNLDKREKVLSEIKEKGFAKDFELTIRHKSGRLVYVLASVETIYIKGKAFALNIIYDISDRKGAEEQLEIVNRELLAFTYSVSHDLRSPLRAISGYAQILLEDYANTLDKDANRILGVIKSNAAKMGTLIDDLLTFSRLGRKEVQKMDINMHDLIATVIEEINKSLPNTAIFQIGTLLPVKADYNLLHQVVINLISNAVKYSSKKDNPLVEIYSESNANEITYTIKDNGSGFDMKYMDKLFGVFQRLHSQDQFEGTGVGLAIVQRIIHKHGGKVWAEGEINKGATFHFSLPN